MQLGHLVHTLQGWAEKGSALLLMADRRRVRERELHSCAWGPLLSHRSLQVVARPHAKGHFGRWSVNERSLQLFSASLPTLEIRTFSFHVCPRAVGGDALCLVPLPVPGVLPHGLGRVQAGSSTRGAEQHAQPGASLCPGSSWLCTARVGFLPKLFSFLSCRLSLRVVVPSCLSSAAPASFTDAPLLLERLALGMFVLTLPWAAGQEQAALLATQLMEMLPACCKQREADLVLC